MALVLEATPAHPGANSYVTLEEADAYHEERLHSTWTAYGTILRTQALITATKLLDSHFEWEQFPTTEDQNLLWPRTGMMGWNQWQYLDEFEIPLRLKDAVSEYAWFLLREDLAEDNSIEKNRLTQLTAGSVSMSFADGVTYNPIPDAVASLIPSWWGWLRGKTGSRESERS